MHTCSGERSGDCETWSANSPQHSEHSALWHSPTLHCCGRLNLCLETTTATGFVTDRLNQDTQQTHIQSEARSHHIAARCLAYYRILSTKNAYLKRTARQPMSAPLVSLPLRSAASSRRLLLVAIYPLLSVTFCPSPSRSSLPPFAFLPNAPLQHFVRGWYSGWYSGWYVSIPFDVPAVITHSVLTAGT